jgi:lipopolysaccharide transport system ATP-binding protein
MPQPPRNAQQDQEMSSTLAIRTCRLCKAYRIYRRKLDLVKELLLRGKRHEDFPALCDVSVEIERGEIVGLVGTNGSGKSTLLRIIAGTLNATAGSVEVNGRISAILELGTGFSPEYTGRENVLFGGLCLGLTKEEIKRRFDWIVDFSELAAVIDQPFKTYSSGMKARLTFATAVCIDAEILIIDEALATGDAYFVAKCLDRIRTIARSGATILFVSHALNLVNDLCSKAYWLDKGRIHKMGPAQVVCSEYELDVVRRQHELQQKESAGQPVPFLSTGVTDNGGYSFQKGAVAISKVLLTDRDGTRRCHFRQGEDICIEIEWQGSHSRPCHFVLGVRSGLGQLVSGFNSSEYGLFKEPHQDAGRVRCVIPRNAFGMGNYFLTVAVVQSDKVTLQQEELYFHKNALEFTIVRNIETSTHRYHYLYEPTVSWETVRPYALAS